MTILVSVCKGKARLLYWVYTEFVFRVILFLKIFTRHPYLKTTNWKKYQSWIPALLYSVERPTVWYTGKRYKYFRSVILSFIPCTLSVNSHIWYVWNMLKEHNWLRAENLTAALSWIPFWKDEQTGIILVLAATLPVTTLFLFNLWLQWTLKPTHKAGTVDAILGVSARSCHKELEISFYSRMGSLVSAYMFKF